MRKSLLVLLGIAMTGCASDVANRYYASEKYSPKPIDKVEVLFKAPSRPYEVIADFQSRGESADDLKKKAAAIGADAIIVTYLGGVYGRKEHWATETQSTKDKHSRVTGTAIRYGDPQGK